MISDRHYRRAMSAEEAMRELRRASGSQFDPAVVEALVVASPRNGTLRWRMDSRTQQP